MPIFPNDYPAYNKLNKDIENDKVLIDQQGTTKAAKISDIAGGVAQNYSTSEQALLNSDGTPLLWIDGKQIYQKSYNTNFNIFDNLGIDNLINVFGSYNNGSGAFYPVTRYIMNTLAFSVNGGTFQTGIDSVPNTRITIQYTKI